MIRSPQPTPLEQSMKTLVLRFDIDTYRCISEGVPSLLRLAREEGVQFTFFCNMGRSICRPVVLKKALRRRTRDGPATTAPKLSATRKLGLRHLVWTLLANPRVGASKPGILQQCLEEGHDVGLHGGLNHGAWQHGFRNWSSQHIRREVEAGKSAFERALDRSPVLFSSPGWQGSDGLNAILESMGFKGSADRHGPEQNQVEYINGFCTVPTNLVAEPGGVAYFESQAARGLGREDIVSQVSKTLEDDRRTYVLYDHPCYAGVHALEVVRSVVRYAKDNGFEITTMATLVERERSH